MMKLSGPWATGWGASAWRAMILGLRLPRAAARGLLVVACAWCAVAQAQTLDDIDVRAQGDLKVVRIRFNPSVGYLQIAPSEASDFYTLRFEVLSVDESAQRQTAEEERRLPAADGLPSIVIGYSPDPSSRVQQLTIKLGQVLPVQARQGANARSIELLIRVAAAAPAAAPTATTEAAPSQAASPEVERDATELMAQAREALAAQQGDIAVGKLDQLLKLPPNSQSMAAQELIGNAWEQVGNEQRARVEYALYLKVYPQGEGAARVAQRLAALGGPPAAAAGPGSPPRAEPARLFSGSLAQYYYGGKARTQSLVNIATGADQATISKTNESAIVTSVDLSGRYAGESGEYRAVVRGSGSTNLLSTSHSSSSIGAAYVEYRRGPEGLAIRAGRQSPISGGLLGLFNGVSLAYPISPGIKLDVMGGKPAAGLVSSPSEQLYAAVLEADSFLERWGGNFYLLDQTTQGITNHRAIGAELRYAGEQWSLNTLIDYEAVFQKINALSVHGSFQVGLQTTVTVLVDERRAPSLQLTDALISSGADSLKTLLQTRSLDQVKSDALATSAIAQQFLVSVSRPLDPRWQLSTDLRYSSVGALPAVGDFQATPATGGQYSWSAQLTGTNLYSKRDINNFNVNVITTPTFKGVQFSYNNLSVLPNRPDITIEPSIRVYLQTGDQQGRLTRIGPGARVSWRASRRASLLGEVLYETSRTDVSASQSQTASQDRSNSLFFYVGYRYELF